MNEDLGAAQLLAFAAMASAEGGLDPVDAAVRKAATAAASPGFHRTEMLIKSTPFDPTAKMSAAVFGAPNGPVRVVKGAPAAVFPLAEPTAEALAITTTLEGQGFRVLAVASGPEGALKMAGFVALSDPPRPPLKSLREP